jgi:3-hydroxymyristoyl/3-hydroxydecanoyl-(acyl carrier protein) dehydratase
VENELAKHDLWAHIIPQLSGFFIGIKQEETRNNLKYKLDWAENKLKVITAIDNFKFDIIVVIDRITFDIKEESKRINKYMQNFNQDNKIKNKTKILFKEFRVFVSENGDKIYHVE